MNMQDQQQVIHASITSGITESQQNHPEWVKIDCRFTGLTQISVQEVNRVSVQCLVDYLQDNRVTSLELESFHLPSLSDGGLDVLCPFFANNTSLTKVVLCKCDFGEGGSQVLESFHNNESVAELRICCGFWYQRGRSPGAPPSQLLENNTTLVRLDLSWCLCIGKEGIGALQQGIQSNRSLRVLRLRSCRIRDGGLGLLVASLVGNTTLQHLDICHNLITPNGIAQHVPTLLQSTRLQVIRVRGYHHDGRFDSQSLQRLRDELLPNPHLLQLHLGTRAENRFPQHVAEIEDILAQNRDWPTVRQTGVNQAKAVLARQPPGNNCAVLLQAIATLAARRCHSGASGVLSILQARPEITEGNQQQLPPQLLLQEQEEQPAQPVQDDNNNYFAALAQDEEDIAALDEDDEEQPLQQQQQAVAVAAPEQVAVAGAAQQPEEDHDMDRNIHHNDEDDDDDDNSSSSHGNPKRQRISYLRE